MTFLLHIAALRLAAGVVSVGLASGAFAQEVPVTPRTMGRAVVAVQLFEDQANSGQAAAFREMVETAVTQTNRFRLITRNETGLNVERRSQRNGQLTNRAGSATTEGAQYIVSGTITTASTESRQNTFGTLARQFGEQAVLGRRTGAVNDCRSVRVTLSIDVRIQDVRTGENNRATSVDERLDSAQECSGQGGGQVNLGILLRSAARRVANLLVTAAYPMQIMAVQPDGTIILNYGDPFLTPGMVLNLYGPASRFVDPATGEERLVDGSILGQIRVVEATQTYSRAQPVHRLTVPPQVGGVARPVPNQRERRGQ